MRECGERPRCERVVEGAIERVVEIVVGESGERLVERVVETVVRESGRDSSERERERVVRGRNSATGGKAVPGRKDQPGQRRVLSSSYPQALARVCLSIGPLNPNLPA